ncbi:flagellin [Frigidibacter sp. MR17.24]|uniref:flagellin n=1 Tax=Frigidibacter sp. MR17.24 TaxID=3127345 RepID=UPI003012E292
MTTVSTVSTYQMSMDNRLKIARLNADLLTANQEVSTGLKSDVYGALGSRASQTLMLRQQMDLADAFVVSNTSVSGRMSAMDSALSTARDAAQDVLALAIPNATEITQTAGTLQMQAKAAFDQIVTALNSNYAGSALFSGTATNRSALQSWSAQSATTGVSPETAMADAVGDGPLTAADAAAMIAQIEQMFASSTGTDADFEGTFYNGTPAETAGVANARQTVRVADGVTLDYGIQANDPAILDTLRGLAMLATTDVSQITDADAYSAWVGEAISALSGGIDGIDEQRSILGNQMKMVEQQTTRQQTLSDLYNNQIVDLEGVDPYEAATRVTLLQSQIEASYAVTARLNEMSILNFL